MSDRPILRDEDIAAVFRRRAQRAEPDDLADAVVRATAVLPQRRGWLQRLRPGRGSTLGRLLLLAVLVLGTAGTLAVAGAVARLIMVPIPDPADGPVVVVSDFVRPFSYRSPEGLPARVGNDHVVHIGSEPMSGAFAVDIVWVDLPLVHECSSGARTPIRDDPAGFFADLGDVGGTTLVGQGAITISGRPSITATVETSCFGDFHVGPAAMSPFVPLGPGARLHALDVDGVTVVIVIWAANPEALDRWLPIATQLVDSIRFDGDDP